MHRRWSGRSLVVFGIVVTLSLITFLRSIFVFHVDLAASASPYQRHQSAAAPCFVRPPLTRAQRDRLDMNDQTRVNDDEQIEKPIEDTQHGQGQVQGQGHGDTRQRETNVVDGGHSGGDGGANGAYLIIGIPTVKRSKGISFILLCVF